MSMMAVVMAAVVTAGAVPVPEATVTLGEPPLFVTERGAEDVAFSPDGKSLAALVGDGNKRAIAVYELASGKMERRFGLLPGKGVARVTWAPQASVIVTATQGIVNTWDAKSGQKLRHIDLGAVFRVEIDRLLVSDRAEFAVYVPRRGMSSATVELNKDKVSVHAIPYRKAVQGFDAMGRLLVSDHEAARLIDPITSRPLQTCAAARTTGQADGYTGTQLWLRGEIWLRQLRNLARCKPSKWQPLRPGANWRQAVVGLRGGIVAAANYQDIVVWDRNGSVLYRYQHHQPVLRYSDRLHVSPDGTHVAFPGRRLRVLRMTDKRWLSLPNDVDDPDQVAMSGDGSVFAVADKMLGTRVFDRRSGRLAAALVPADKLALGKTGDEVLTLRKKRVALVDVGTGQVLWEMPIKASHLAISADRTTVAVGGTVGTASGVTVFEWTRQRPALRQITFANDTGWTSSVALNRNGSQVMATLGSSHNLYVLDVLATRLDVRHQHSFKSRGGLSRGIFLPGDTHLLTTPAFRKRVDVVNTDTGNHRTLAGGSYYASAAVALPGGKRVVLSDEAGRIALWDLAAKKKQVRWRAHANAVRGIASSADGRWLVSAGRDGRVKVWPIGGQISAATAVSSR